MKNATVTFPEILCTEDGWPRWLRRDLASSPRQAFRYICNKHRDEINDFEYLERFWVEPDEEIQRIRLSSYRTAIAVVKPIWVEKRRREDFTTPEADWFTEDFPYWEIEEATSRAVPYWRVLYDV